MFKEKDLPTEVEGKESGFKKSDTLKGKRNRKSRRGSSKSEEHRKGSLPIYKRGPNDSSWRTANELSTFLAANLPFSIPNGISIDIGISSTHKYRNPGVMRIGTLVTDGFSDNYNSPLNMVARQTFSYIRKANAGAKNYDSTDLLLVMLGCQQAYALTGWLQRLYKVICKFSATDRFLPRTLVSAMEVNYDDIISHQAELAWLIRWVGNALNSISMPKMPIFTASYEAFKHIYTDDSSPKKQIYMLDAYTFGVYDPIYSTTGGGVTFHAGDSKLTTWAASSTTGLTFAEITKMVHDIMDPLLGDEDVAIICGDILKAYTEENLFRVVADTMDILELEYSEEILQQFHNCKCFPVSNGYLSAYDQNAGSPNLAPFVESSMVFNSGIDASDAARHEYDIDAFSDKPDPKEVVNCTALQVRCQYHLTSTTPYNFIFDSITWDLFLPVSITIYMDPTSFSPTWDISGICNDLYCKTVYTISAWPGAFRSMNFDWTPYSFIRVTEDGESRDIAFGDVRMINFFKYSVHQRIHENSVLCLFNLLTN